MALINTSVTNLIQGVSQQPDSVRFTGQCEEQENALPSIVDGLQKRPAAEFVANIMPTEALSADAKVHFVERDDNERYAVVIKGTDSKTVTAYNLTTGAQANIAQRYRAVVTGDTGPPVAVSTYFEYTVKVTQKPPVSFTAAGSGSAADFVRVVDGAKASSSTYDLLSVDKENKQIKFKVTEPDFSLKGVGSGELQNTIDFFIAAAPSVEAEYLSKKDDDTNTTAKTDIKTLTTGDFTYLLNTTKTVSTDDTKSARLNNNALVFIKQGDYEKKYGVNVELGDVNYENWVYSGASQRKETGGSSSTYYNTAKNAQADYILETLFSSSVASVKDASGQQNVDPSIADDEDAATNRALKYTGVSTSLGANSAFTSTVLSPQLGEIKYSGDAAFTIHGVDSLGGEGIGVAHKSVTTITDLPKVAPHRFKIKVRGDIEENTDDRYVKFLVSGSNEDTEETNIGQGSWVECAGDEVIDRIDVKTMPLILKNTGVNTFELSHMPLDPLLAGDENTNPNPSFVGGTISGLFQFKARLGFLSGASISMSEAKFGSFNGDTEIQHYNFYRTSVVSLLDTDPIDVNISSAKVINVRDAMAFQDNLVLFSDFGQFILRGGDVLTPKTVSVNPVTEFEYDSSVSPIALGAYIYFPFKRGGFTGVREFTVNSNTDVYDANEITSHVPQYIPTGLVSLTGASSEEIMAICDGTDVYIYKYFFSGQEKSLSSWSKFTVSGGNVRGIGFIDSDLYVIQALSGVEAVSLGENQTHLLKIPLGNKHRDAEGYNTHLDRRVSTTLDTTAASPLITLDYGLRTNENVQVFSKDGVLVGERGVYADDDTYTGNLIVSVRQDGDDYKTDIKFRDDFVSAVSGSAVGVYVGTPYTMKYTFSEQMFKASSGNQMSPTNAGRMLIRNGTIFFTDTSHFKVKVTPDLRQESKSEFNATIVSATTEGSLPLESNSFRFPVFTDPTGTTITIENDTPGPCNLQSAEFESFIHQRSRRYG
tara:strand:- start:554 stop:3523 length:2970 start_codon:yes stop_codon:yes gene_type:complete